MESGVNADIIVCRTEHKLSNAIKSKIALFCNVQNEAVIESIDAETIYDVPILMQKERLDKVVLKKLGLSTIKSSKMDKWKVFLHKLKNSDQTVNIGLVGKYVELQDSYKSILESLTHAGVANEVKVNIITIHSEFIDEKNSSKLLKSLNGIIVAPGFGERGIEGKINAIRYSRENNVPFLGICLGMQMAVIEYARNVLRLEDVNSIEMKEDCKNPIISLMEDQKSIVNKGGTMRLGAWDCKLLKNSKTEKIYNKKVISERHRHRYELNNKYLDRLNKGDLIPSGINPETDLVEIIEHKGHPWFIGVQFHPEYSSTVLEPHPLFKSFINSSIENLKNNNK
jgi:CTP synthase